MIQGDPTTINGLPEDELVVGVFIGVAKDHTPRFAVTTVTYDRASSTSSEPVVKSIAHEFGPRSGTGPFYFEAYGEQELVREVTAGQTERARKLNAEWAQIYSSKTANAIESIAVRVVEETIAYSTDGKVGGEVDAVGLNAAGLHWISRKPSCPQN